MYSHFLIVSTNLWETGEIPSVTTNEEGVGAVRGSWLNSLVDIMTGDSSDNEE